MNVKKRRVLGLTLVLGGIALVYWAFGLFLLQVFDWARHGRWFDLPLSALFLAPPMRESLALDFVPCLPAALVGTGPGPTAGAAWLLGQPIGAVFSVLAAVLVWLGGSIYE